MAQVPGQAGVLRDCSGPARSRNFVEFDAGFSPPRVLLRVTCYKSTPAPVPAKSLHIAVQYEPASAGPPTITLTDEFGLPITEGGTVLSWVPDSSSSSEAQALHGTLGPGFVWWGCSSNVQVQDPAEPGSLVYGMELTWPGPITPAAAVWFSDDLDANGSGIVVDDAYAEISEAVATSPKSWGEQKVRY